MSKLTDNQLKWKAHIEAAAAANAQTNAAAI